MRRHRGFSPVCVCPTSLPGYKEDALATRQRCWSEGGLHPREQEVPSAWQLFEPAKKLCEGKLNQTKSARVKTFLWDFARQSEQRENRRIQLSEYVVFDSPFCSLKTGGRRSVWLTSIQELLLFNFNCLTTIVVCIVCRFGIAYMQMVKHLFLTLISNKVVKLFVHNYKSILNLLLDFWRGEGMLLKILWWLDGWQHLI